MRFKCDHNKLSADRLSKIGSQPKQRTARPDTCENRCEFDITVFYAEDQCWYLSSRDETGSKRTKHRGHVQIPPVNVKSKISEIDEQAPVELAMQCSELELDDTLITLPSVLLLSSPGGSSSSDSASLFSPFCTVQHQHKPAQRSQEYTSDNTMDIRCIIYRMIR